MSCLGSNKFAKIYENVNLNSEFVCVCVCIYKVLGENKASVISIELQLSLLVQEP